MAVHFEISERLRRIHELIQQERTGTPDKFAERLHISRRQLYNILEECKDRGVFVRYNRVYQTFCYADNSTTTILELFFTTNHTNEKNEK